MGFPWEWWKWNDSASDNWQEWFSRLDWRDQATIREIADEKFGWNIVEAMKFRFKWNIAFALNGQMPKDWQLYSDDERKSMSQTRQEIQTDPGLRGALEDLFTWLDGFDDDTPIEDDPELKNKKKK